MTHTGRRVAALILAMLTWPLAAADVFLSTNYAPALSRLALGVAVLATFYLMLTARTRPIGQAFDLGYEAARRDFLREANRAAKRETVTPLYR